MKKTFYLLLLVTSLVNAQLTKSTYFDKDQKLEGFFIKAKVANPKNIGILILPAIIGKTKNAKITNRFTAKNTKIKLS